MAAISHDEAILYGAVALQYELLDQATLLAALELWSADRSRPLSDLLRESGVDERAIRRIEEAVDRELERHGQDPTETLAQLDSTSGLVARLDSAVGRESDEDRGGLETVLPDAPTGPPSAAGPEAGETDPLATLEGPLATFDPSAYQAPSDINPLQSDEHDIEPASPPSAGPGSGSGTGSVPTPDLSPASSYGPPSGPVSSGGPGSVPDEARFDPNATSVYEAQGPADSGTGATSGHGSLDKTELDPFATAMGPDPGAGLLQTQAESDRTEVMGGSSTSAADLGLLSTGSSSRFRVLRPHAKGGLGAVLIAFDQELRREVALKEIRDQHADNADSRARFLMEAEVTGGLEHPGVVPVYSLGRGPDGRPFYAMRFIRGESLRKAIERFHSPGEAARDQSERSVEFRNLLRRFIDVCNAIEYAHSRQVIHRDIKPDNIMLGPYGETLVVDWGLAKALDKADLPSRTEELPLKPVSVAGSTPTLDGSAIGTPAFMGPEQAEGDVARMGPCSDIYSLGATLYNLLTGQPPFTDRNLFQMLIKVRNGEFPPPRQVRPEVPAALEAICLKAMAKAAEDRYPSCRALADDLEHWLADEPVSVYREPLTVRLGRWAKRHRTLVTGVAVLLVTAVVGLSIGSYLIDQQRRLKEKARQEAVEAKGIADEQRDEAQRQKGIADIQRDEAQRQKGIADEQRDEAQRQKGIADRQAAIARRNFASAMSAVDTLLSEVGEIDLADVPQMEETRSDLLTKALGFYQNFLAENDSELVRREVGNAHSRVGDIQHLLGQNADAEAAYRKALEIQRALLAENPDDPDLAADLARTEHELAILLKELNRFDESQQLLDEAREARSSLHDEAPDDLDYQADLASSIYQMGAVLARLVGGEADARTLYEEAIRLQRDVVAGRDGDPEERRELARYLNNLALLLRGKQPAEANAAFEEAIPIQQRLHDEHSETPHYARELARTLNNQATSLIASAPDQAEKPVREAIALTERLTTDYPKVPDYWQELGGYLSNLGQILKQRGVTRSSEEDAEEAEDLFGRAEAAFRKAEAIRSGLVERYPDRPDYRHRLALLRQNLARFIQGRSGDPEESVALLESAAETLRDLADRYPSVAEYRKDYALTRSYQSRFSVEVSKDLDLAYEQATAAIDAIEMALADRPTDAIYVGEAHKVRYLSLSILRDRGDYRRLAEQAERYGEESPGDPAALYTTAAFLAEAARQSAADESVAGAEREALGEEYAVRSLDWLARAAEAGLRLDPKYFTGDFKGFLDQERFIEALQRISEPAGPAR